MLKGVIEKIGYDYDIDIVELEIPKDHIHMVVRGVPKESPSDVMQVIKSILAREFFRRFPQIKLRYFWGEKLWTQSCFVEAIVKKHTGDLDKAATLIIVIVLLASNSSTS